ncbi:MAG: hypothetical protein H6741_10075, partial [Alphaproteobacteria bacterium]|nr:hypothetical protein [Alphaproteobacteria bacterium]
AWDPDGDGYGAWEDLDSDGDGVLDRDEAGDEDLCSAPCDVDGDGVGDWLDPDVRGAGCPQDTGDSGGADDSGGDSRVDSGGDSRVDSGVDSADTQTTGQDSAPLLDDSGGPGLRAGLSGGLRACGCGAAPGLPGLGPLALLALVALRRRRPGAPR